MRTQHRWGAETQCQHLRKLARRCVPIPLTRSRDARVPQLQAVVHGLLGLQHLRHPRKPGLTGRGPRVKVVNGTKRVEQVHLLPLELCLAVATQLGQ